MCAVTSRGIYLGRSVHGDVTSGAERSSLVLGPSRSGKTSSIVIPNLLMSDATALVTSTKDDVLRATVHGRGDGATLLFDPSGTVHAPAGVVRVGYSPLRQARTWDGAVLVTRTLVDVARRGARERADDHWTERAGALLAPLLHAAALADESLARVARRVDERRGDDVLAALRERIGEDHAATSLLAGVLATDERERSGIWSTASGLFAGLRTDAAREAARAPLLDLEEFLSAPHRLHVVAPSRFQAASVPLVVGLIDEVVHATYDRHRDGAVLLLALDELANVAPVPGLAGIVSEGGGQGVLTLACLQDLSQARARWGSPAEGFLSLFPTALILPGIADRPTLELLDRLAGRRRVAAISHQRDRRGRVVGSSTQWRDEDRAPPARLARGRPGHALALGTDKELRWVELVPAHRDPRLRGYLESRERPSSRER
jgi:type IV secretion system protein VirD4